MIIVKLNELLIRMLDGNNRIVVAMHITNQSTQTASVDTEPASLVERLLAVVLWKNHFCSIYMSITRSACRVLGELRGGCIDLKL